MGKIRLANKLDNIELFEHIDKNLIHYSISSLKRTFCTCGYVGSGFLPVCPNCGNNKIIDIDPREYYGQNAIIPFDKDYRLIVSGDKVSIGRDLLRIEKLNDEEYNVKKEFFNNLSIWPDNIKSCSFNYYNKDIDTKSALNLIFKAYENGELSDRWNKFCKILRPFYEKYPNYDLFTYVWFFLYDSPVKTEFRDFIDKYNNYPNFMDYISEFSSRRIRNTTGVLMGKRISVKFIDSLVSFEGIDAFLSESGIPEKFYPLAKRGYGFYESVRDFGSTFIKSAGIDENIVDLLIHYTNNGSLNPNEMVSILRTILYDPKLCDKYPKLITKYMLKYTLSQRSSVYLCAKKVFSFLNGNNIDVNEITLDWKYFCSNAHVRNINESGKKTKEAIDNFINTCDTDFIGSLKILADTRKQRKKDPKIFSF